MNYKLLALLVMGLFWLKIPEYRLIIGLGYLTLIFIETIRVKERVEIKILWLIILLQVIPFINSREVISGYILIFCVIAFVATTVRFLSKKTILILISLTTFFNIAFNVLYSYAGKALSLSQFMGFDNSGHLGILMAVNSSGGYLNFFNSGKPEIGLQFWQYYPQGVMGSIESIMRILGLEHVDDNRFSVYVLFLIFNIAMYIVFLLLFYRLLKRYNVNNLMAAIAVFSLSFTSIISIFLFNGFANYMYSLIILLIYALISEQDRSFIYKCLILLTMVLSTPFILPIFIFNEIVTYSIRNKHFDLKTKIQKITEVIFYLLVFSIYYIYYLDKWGYGYLSVPGGIAPIDKKFFIVFVIFWIIFIRNRFITKMEITKLESIVGASQLIFILLSIIVFTQSQSVSYYAIKQGYIAVIITIIYILKEAMNLNLKSFNQTLIIRGLSLFMIFAISYSSGNIFNRISFYNENGAGSPWIPVNGSKIINSIAIARNMKDSDFIYTGLYDSDLSSRLLNGGVSKWDDYSSGLFYGLTADADSITLRDKIENLSKWLMKIKQGNRSGTEYVRPLGEMIVFYEKNTKLSSEINGNLNTFQSLLIE